VKVRALLLAALVVAAVVALPIHDHQDQHSLGETQEPEEVVPPQEPEEVVATATVEVHKDAPADESHIHTQRVIDAVHHVWRTSDFRDMFKEEMAHGHWHCKRCHSNCETVKCNKWCSDNFCGPDYSKLLAAKMGVGRMGIDKSQRVTPQYVKTVRDANVALQKAEKATSDADFRSANRQVGSVEEAQEEDYDHMKNALKHADGVDKSAYPSEREQEQNEDNMYLMEKTEAKQSLALAKEDEQTSEKAAAKNEAAAEATEASGEVDKAMGAGGSMMAEIAEVSSAEDDTLQQNAGKQKQGKPQMAKVEDVSAEAAKLDVKLNGAAGTWQ